MNCKRARNQRGSTLMESLVALALFSIGAAAISTLLTQHIQQQVTNGTGTTAIALAGKETENVRALDYQDISCRAADSVVDGANYHIETTVIDNHPKDNMKSVTTTVTWTEPRGPQTYSLYAIYTSVTE